MRGLTQSVLDFFDATVAAVAPTEPDVSAASDTAGAQRPAYTHPRANRLTRLGGVPVAYEFRRGRRRTIGMAVGEPGLTVSAPRWTSLGEVEAVLQEKAAWILRKLQEMQTRQQRTQAARLQWRAGTVLPWLGQPLTLALTGQDEPLSEAGAARRSRRRAAPVLDAGGVALSGLPAWPEGVSGGVSGNGSGATLRLDLPADAPPEHIHDMVRAWFLQEARALYAQRLDHYAPMLQVQWRKLALSNARTRWGSASSDGRIHLNWRLLHLPLAVIDYVVVHELSHLRVMDHSPRFWDTVRSVLPDYEQQRAVLRDVALPPWR
jgi:predicted metal-dependent hydrolase